MKSCNIVSHHLPRKILPVVVIIFSLAICQVALAKDKNPKDYPLSGTIISFHAQQEVSGNEDSVNTFERRVYVLKTDTGTLEISGWENGFKARKRPTLSIGQMLKFRTDEKFIYTQLDDGKEHRYYIMSSN